MPRISFPADTPLADLRDWIASAVAEAFTTARVLPHLRRPRPEPEPALPLLFEALPVQRRGEPPVAAPSPEARQAPAPGTPIAKVLLAHFEGAITPPSPLALKRRARKAEREAEAAATRKAEAVAPGPVPEAAPPHPEPLLTMDMGRFRDAHGIDRCEVGPKGGYVVSCPPFHLHDEDEVEPSDEFLGQVVGVEKARALLFRRRDPHVMDRCEVGQRYVLMRFWEDEDGQVWSMPVSGDDDASVHEAIGVTVTLYERSRR